MKSSRKPIRKRSLVKTLFKKSLRAAERSLIAATNRRDKTCQLCASNFVLQADHAVISRKHMSTFLDIRNTLLLCSKCHLSKTFGNHGMVYRVIEKIRAREGSQFINELIARSKQIKKWTIGELEDMKTYLEGLYL